MKTTNEFLDAVRTKHGLTSDNQLALFLGCTRSGISGYRHNKTFLDDAAVLKVAAALDADPAHIMACVHAERAKDATIKKIWSRIADMTATAAVLFVVFGLVIMTNPAPTVSHWGASTIPANFNLTSLYIMRDGVWLEWVVFFALAVGLLISFPWHTLPKKHRDGRRTEQ